MVCKKPSGSKFEVKVGSGHVMTIWDDFLLAGKECRRIQELRVNTNIQWVSQLIDQPTKTWNEELVCTLFSRMTLNRFFVSLFPSLDQRMSWFGMIKTRVSTLFAVVISCYRWGFTWSVTS